MGISEPTDQDLITQQLYDGGSRAIQTIDANNVVTSFTYDLRNQIIKVIENDQTSCSSGATDCDVTTQYRYDRVGNRTAIVDAKSHVRTFAYDAANQQISATDALTRTTVWEYNKLGMFVRIDDPRGASSDLYYSYDNLNHTTAITATGLTTPIQMTYDGLGRRKTLIDATGTTTFTYDVLSRMTQFTPPLGNTVSYEYNARGERTKLSYASSTPQEYTYWPDGRMKTMAQSTTTHASYSYDTAGRLTKLARSTGANTTYTYDNADRLTKRRTYAFGELDSNFTYTLNRTGLRTALSESRIITATTNRLSNAGFELDTTPADGKPDDWETSAAAVSRSSADSYSGTYSMRHQSTTNPNYSVYQEKSNVSPGLNYAVSGWVKIPATGDTFTFAIKVVWRNTLGQTLQTDTVQSFSAATSGWTQATSTVTAPTGAFTARIQLDITSLNATIYADDFSFVASPSVSNESRTTTYDYDGLKRLTSAVESPGTTYTYTYDLVGNRLEAWQNSVRVGQWSYDAADQVSNVGWTYDAAGNLTNDGTTTFSYDPLKRLSSGTQGGMTSTYSYNGDGTLLKQVVGTTITTYTQDLAGSLSQILQVQTAGTTTNYHYGLQRLSQASGARSWYETDALDSVRLIFDNVNVPLTAVRYDPWGVPVSTSQPNPFGFTGEFVDGNTDLMYLRARWYQPVTGRFLRHDPYQGNPQLPYTQHYYQYAYNNPVLLTDRSGLSPTSVTPLEDYYIRKQIVASYMLYNQKFVQEIDRELRNDEYRHIIDGNSYYTIKAVDPGPALSIIYNTFDESWRHDVRDWKAGNSTMIWGGESFYKRRTVVGLWPILPNGDFKLPQNGHVVVVAWLQGSRRRGYTGEIMYEADFRDAKKVPAAVLTMAMVLKIPGFKEQMAKMCQGLGAKAGRELEYGDCIAMDDAGNCLKRYGPEDHLEFPVGGTLPGANPAGSPGYNPNLGGRLGGGFRLPPVFGNPLGGGVVVTP